MVAIARLYMKAGLTAKEAAAETEKYIRDNYPEIAKQYRDLYGAIYWGLRKGK
jgi:hypothetical protein